METIFDFGMSDGSDSEYYLQTGHKVVAVDAYLPHCNAVAKRFGKYMSSGQLTIENVAISNTPGTINLHICGQDLGSNSIFAERLEDRSPLGKYTVPTTTYDGLMAKYGKPMYLKIDIEGADKECVLSLKHETAPPYLSFEAHQDMEELIDHCFNVGYRYFKVIHQNSFRCIQKQECLSDRIGMKIVRIAGYDKPLVRKIDGRFYVLGHSAGPAPWQSDGRWYDRAKIIRDWKKTQRRGWYDVHAARRDAHLHLAKSKVQPASEWL